MAERPEYLTVPEVMARLRLGRTTVYEQARLYLATNGAEGIPCRRFGRSLRFPTAAFEAPTAGEGAMRTATDVVDLPSNRQRRTAAPPDPPSRSTRRTRTVRRPRGDDQVTLPFTR
jgi:Helix-turn-helix domain